MTTVQTKALDTFIRETGGAVAAQLEACTRCGICAEACHFYVSTHKPEYTPIWKVELLRRAYEQQFTPIGKLKVALGLDKPVTEANLQEWIEYDYYACTMCQRCSMVCPMGIQIGDLIHQMRAGLYDAGLIPADLKNALDNQLNDGQPAGRRLTIRSTIAWNGSRDDWDCRIPDRQEGRG